MNSMNREKLHAAAEQGLIRDDQVEPLLDFLGPEARTPDDQNSGEPLRFLRSFGDIHITLGIVLIALAIAQIEMHPFLNIIPVVTFFAITEWLARIQRLALSGIALLLVILFFSSLMITSLLDYDVPILAALTAVAGVFYWRYRIPFAVVPIAFGILCIFNLSIGSDIDYILAHQHVLSFYGLWVFGAAMRFDARDTARTTRASDTGFWLHLLAAPLIVHGVMIGLLTSADPLPFRDVLILLLFSGFFLVSLYIDRRALLVSSLSYAMYAAFQLVKENRLNIENATLIVFAVFGLFIVFFGAYWYAVRRRVFAGIAPASLSSYVPDFSAEREQR